tara:strand:- start:32761 stop:33372 length:612 start_codon:yes stop_codon:yes gene_type:complete
VVSASHPVLSLWDEPAPHHRDRVVTDGRDRVAWFRARSRGVTASDAARLGSRRAIAALAREKTSGSGFRGNAYTEHGRRREPEIAAWASRVYQMTASASLFHAAGNPLHLATPDGLRERDGRVELCEIKTTSSAWTTIPRSYLRQVWWQQYVLGAERTLVVWEQHRDFVPVGREPQCRWVDRDETQIRSLVELADELLDALRA